MQGLRGRLTLSQVVIADEWKGPPPGKGGWSLWYFGSSSQRLLDMSTAKNVEDTVFPAGEAVNAAATRLRAELLELDAQLASRRFPLAWAASDLAERNPLTSDVCIGICRAVALVETARDGGAHLVVVDDAGFGRALVELCRRAGLVAVWRGTPHRPLRRVLSAWRTHRYFLRLWRETRSRVRRWRSAPIIPGQLDVVLMTWVDHRTFTNTDALRVDRFFGSLPAWLRDGGRRFCWLGNVLGPMSRITETAGASGNEPVVLASGSFGLGSLVRAYFSLMAFPLALRRRLTIGGIDVSPLIGWARGRELASPRLVSAAMYLAVARTLRRLRLTPRVLFYTYENQPWEKVMLAGFRRVLPSTTLIGVQHAPFAGQYLSAYPSRRQWSDGTTPDLLVTIGEEFRESVIAAGAPPDRVMVGGALRYPDILTRRGGGRIREPDGTRRILVACSIDLNEAIELTHKAATATAGLAEVALVINFHPMANEDFRATVRDRMAQAADRGHVSFVEDSADALIGTVDVVLYNASGTSFEAVAAGVPTIFVGSELALDLDKMAGEGGASCRRVDELRRLILRLLDDAEFRRDRVRAGQMYLRRCFSLPSVQIWSDLAAGMTRRMERAA